MSRSRRSRAAGETTPAGIELGERLVAVAAGLVAGVVAGAGPLEDRDDLGDVARASGRPWRVELGEPRAVLGAAACSSA